MEEKISLPTKTNSHLKKIIAFASLGCGIFSIILIPVPFLLFIWMLTFWISASSFAHLIFNLLIAIFWIEFLFAMIGFGMGIYAVITSKVSTERKFAIGGIVTSLITLIFLGWFFSFLYYL